MHKSVYMAVALAVGTATAVLPLGQARAAEELVSPLIPPKQAPQAIPQEVIGAWSCVALGSAGTAFAMVANSENLLNLVAGGVVTPANPTVLYLGLAGVVFTTFCTLGQQLSPLYTYYFRSPPALDVDMANSPSGRVARIAHPVPGEDDDVMYPWQSAR